MRRTLFLAPTALLILMGCATTNRLAEQTFRGATFAAYVRIPPAPEVSADYSFHIDTQNPIASAIRVGTSLAKASEVYLAEERLRAALEDLDIRDRLHGYIHDEAAAVLGCRAVGDVESADYVLDVDVQEYGIEAYSSGLAFTMSVRLELVDRRMGAVIWRRRLSEEESLSPDMFGLTAPLGNVITTIMLSELTEEQMAEGFEHLVDSSAKRVVWKLEDDYLNSRYQ